MAGTFCCQVNNETLLFRAGSSLPRDDKKEFALYLGRRPACNAKILPAILFPKRRLKIILHPVCRETNVPFAENLYLARKKIKTSTPWWIGKESWHLELSLIFVAYRVRGACKFFASDNNTDRRHLKIVSRCRCRETFTNPRIFLINISLPEAIVPTSLINYFLKLR